MFLNKPKRFLYVNDEVSTEHIFYIFLKCSQLKMNTAEKPLYHMWRSRWCTSPWQVVSKSNQKDQRPNAIDQKKTNLYNSIFPHVKNVILRKYWSTVEVFNLAEGKKYGDGCH